MNANILEICSLVMTRLVDKTNAYPVLECERGDITSNY